MVASVVKTTHGGDMSNPDLGRTYYREDAGKPKG